MEYVIGALCCGLPLGVLLAYAVLCAYFAKGAWRG